MIAAVAIEFVKLRLLRTTFPFCCRFLGWRFAGHSRVRIRTCLRINWQLAHRQLHGALDRNVAATPAFSSTQAVAVELILLIHQEVAKLAAFVGLKHGPRHFL